jgi:peptidylprolyl isomerase
MALNLLQPRGRSRKTYGLPLAVALLPSLAFGLSGCAAGGSGTPPDITQMTFAPELEIDLSQMTLTEDGVYFLDLAEGTGEEARWNRRVTLHYMGWHPDGTLFDSSLASGGPIRFTVGNREVIRGWELGIQGMKEGGRRRLVVPPRLGYGSRGLRGVVPGNAVLIFEVQLLEIGE